MDTWDRGAPRGTAPPHQVSEQSRRAEEKAQAAQTGSRKASGRRGEVGPLPWLLCTKHRNPAGWGRRAETRTQHPCSGEEAPRPGATRGLRGKARPTTTTTTAVPRCRQVRGIPCGAGWGVLGQRQRRGWGAGGVGSYTSGDREAASRNSSEAMLWAPRASLELERPLPEILEREGLGQKEDPRPIQEQQRAGAPVGGCSRTKTTGCPPQGRAPPPHPTLAPGRLVSRGTEEGDIGREGRWGGELSLRPVLWSQQSGEPSQAVPGTSPHPPSLPPRSLLLPRTPPAGAPAGSGGPAGAGRRPSTSGPAGPAPPPRHATPWAVKAG